ncbi:NeuD/PglB/VioB family sugar acetyltransferase [Apirhabdus apintestini]|uniref:NeuD/PglB/VioB family sugar acetyltransferase n=1 Tax=Erwinia sp. HR93 TaxID=3094840 RepID=UPI002ADEDF81|nr:NeuD/PglB/VioB family sugar acetyltransferase [Erwinia sp. HR93]MEA1065403.1 NeuD/PglB/VioB family sugar acetyltransferase [Erwinia sp. HR93]WPM85590.1 NeuD/PglB/VioB family sugar acetyltransferase [Enterobacteriaceae bacterium CA-0114]
MKKKLIIIGAGGFAKAVVDSLDHDEYIIVGFLDKIKSESHLGYPILGASLDELEFIEDYKFFIAIGNPDHRDEWFTKIKEKELETINVIDKTAILSARANLGTCIYIGKMAIVNCDSYLEDGVVVNTRALIEHGNHISYCSNISTNVVLNGDVQVGEKTFVGSCTVVNGQIKIGSSSIIGSGSVVIRNIPNNVVVAGSPTRLLKERKNNE